MFSIVATEAVEKLKHIKKLVADTFVVIAILQTEITILDANRLFVEEQRWSKCSVPQFVICML